MVKMKTSLATEWKNARLLEGNIFEKELDLITGGNTINVQATDGSNNTSNYNYNVTLATPAAANTYTYDADGNLLSDGIRSYTWDCFSRLVSIAWGGGSNKTTSYLYNAQGQRCEQIDKTGSTETAHFYYLCDGIQLLARYTGGTTLSNIDRRYNVQGEQRKISNIWQSYYYNRDHLGSIREVLNADGSLAARYDYTPYGQRLTRYQATSYSTCDLGFTGHITQVSPVANQKELVLTFYRIYDPTTARWLSPDPLGEEGGLNLYQYCASDPVNMWDPLGLWQVTIFGGHVLGGYLTFGLNGGQFNVGVRVGVAEGLSASLDVKDSGCRPTGLGAAVGADATVGAGVLGGAAGASIDSRQGDTLYLGGRLGPIGATNTWSNTMPLYSPSWTSSSSGGVCNYGASGFVGVGVSYTGSVPAAASGSGHSLP